MSQGVQQIKVWYIVCIFFFPGLIKTLATLKDIAQVEARDLWKTKVPNAEITKLVSVLSIYFTGLMGFASL